MTTKATPARLFDTSSAQRKPGRPLVVGKTGIISGLTNEQSITWRCARALRGIGADLCIVYRNERSRKFTEPLTPTLDVLPTPHLPCDVHLRAHTSQ